MSKLSLPVIFSSPWEPQAVVYKQIFLQTVLWNSKPSLSYLIAWGFVCFPKWRSSRIWRKNSGKVYHLELFPKPSSEEKCFWGQIYCRNNWLNKDKCFCLSPCLRWLSAFSSLICLENLSKGNMGNISLKCFLIPVYEYIVWWFFYENMYSNECTLGNVSLAETNVTHLF